MPTEAWRCNHCRTAFSKKEDAEHCEEKHLTLENYDERQGSIKLLHGIRDTNMDEREAPQTIILSFESVMPYRQGRILRARYVFDECR